MRQVQEEKALSIVTIHYDSYLQSILISYMYIHTYDIFIDTYEYRKYQSIKIQ